MTLGCGRLIVHPCCGLVTPRRRPRCGGSSSASYVLMAFDRAPPGSATLSVLAKVHTLLWVDGDAEFNEINGGSDLRGNFIRS